MATVERQGDHVSTGDVGERKDMRTEERSHEETLYLDPFASEILNRKDSSVVSCTVGSKSNIL